MAKLGFVGSGDRSIPLDAETAASVANSAPRLAQRREAQLRALALVVDLQARSPAARQFHAGARVAEHRMSNRAADPAAADAFLMWDKDHQDGQLVVVPGLLKRRQIERAYYLNLPV